MKKFLGIALVALLIGNCAILNPLGLTYDRESGSDAKDRIYNAALTGELLLSARFGNSGNLNIRGLFYAQITNNLVNVDGSKYYLKPSVDRCVESIEEAGTLLLAARVEDLTDAIEYKRIFAPALVCELEEDGFILGKPILKF